MADLRERLSTALADRYRIEHELGQGGMATVYLAQDLKHNRKVAIKVLKPELAAVLGAERFLREIATTAQLQHPHILPLFDSGRTGGKADGRSDEFLYYVMPYIEGETLRQKLNRETQLGVGEAVRITIDVADALDYAHRRGVVHRDIKPENILLHDGRPMVADFGIALAVDAAAAGRLTETGLSLGTPYYMSPEQATAEKNVTARSDIYSLGAVLYEMLTGEPPHTGATAQQVLMKVIAEPVAAVVAVRKSVPPNVAAALAKALEKLPADRFESAQRFAQALNDPAFARATAAGSVAGPGTGRGLNRPAIVLGVLAACFAVLAAREWFAPAPRPTVDRYGLALPPDEALRDLAPRTFALSPDGSWLVYVGPGSTPGGQLWVKARNRYEATALAGTGGAIAPAVSPDGRRIVFTAAGRLQEIPAGGGTVITLADSAFPTTGGIWVDQGTVAYVDNRARLRRVSSTGGESKIVLRQDAGVAAIPTSALPDGRGLLVKKCDVGCVNVSDLWVVDLRSRTSHVVVRDVVWGNYVDGLLTYIRRDGAVFAVPFDLRSLTVRGTPVPVLDGVKVDAGNIPDFALSRSGSLAYLAALAHGLRWEAVWVSRDGRAVPVDTAWTFNPGGPISVGWAISPDGKRLAIGLRSEANQDIWIKDLDHGPLSRLTFSSAAELRPAWTPDGRAVAFVSNANARSPDLHLRRADGTGGDSLLFDFIRPIWGAVYVGNGRSLILESTEPSSHPAADLVMASPGSDRRPVSLLVAPYDETEPALSPDGHWLAYVSTETGRGEVFVRPFPDVTAGKWQISTGGGRSPLWAHSGRELFFVSGARALVSQSLVPGASFAPGAQKVLFPIGDRYVLGLGLHAAFDVGPRDRRFLMVRQASTATAAGGGPAALIMVEHWIEEVKAKVNGD